jgi:D-alanyl-lipoteichoic acid acyltransferase DltB (MBOAT superfamily)
VLFNSYSFLFLFLPIVATVFFLLGKYRPLFAEIWLFMASVFFYGWWNPVYIILLSGSILFNYGIGLALIKEQSNPNKQPAKWILRLGIAVDLCLLGYFKYMNFFIENIELLSGQNWQYAKITLPLGISFFTFTQIAFLVDAYRGLAKETNIIHYGLFVTYFPHLIAGPVLHHKEMMPQFRLPETYKLHWDNLSVGLTIFIFGLFKKVVLADGISPFVDPVFSSAANGDTLSFLEAWGGALAYTFQLYFDFSGYSDMAIGLSRLFGVKLPLNFDSPYKAQNIIEFWRRWHMTLSRFLRDYLYFSLGGNRKGPVRRYINLFLTMLLGGLWHGAGWTFVIWGGLHGIYLSINHVWQHIRTTLGFEANSSSATSRFLSMLLTFIAVIVGWVFFRSPNFSTALQILQGMAGLNGLTIPSGIIPGQFATLLNQHGINIGGLPAFTNIPGNSRSMLAWVAALWAIAWLAPNTQQIMANFQPSLNISVAGKLQWQPTTRWLIPIALALLYSINQMDQVSEFLYFQF